MRGNVAELGTYMGTYKDNTERAAAMARRMGTTRWILDTFEGFDPDDLKEVDACALTLRRSDACALRQHPDASVIACAPSTFEL